MGLTNATAKSLHVGAARRTKGYNLHNTHTHKILYRLYTWWYLMKHLNFWTLDCIFVLFSQIFQVKSSLIRDFFRQKKTRPFLRVWPSFALLKVSDSSNLLVAATLKPDKGHSTFHGNHGSMRISDIRKREPQTKWNQYIYLFISSVFSNKNTGYVINLDVLYFYIKYSG